MPAVSKQQQKFFGVVKAMQKGDIPKKGAAGKVAKDMSKKDVDKMASTKHKDLPKKVAEAKMKRINRELDADFDIDKFRFYASYNVFSGAIESYLVSQEEQVVFIKQLGQSFSFEAWEPIHTEYSYKYLESDIESLAGNTGFKIEKQLYDSQCYFVDSIWRVEKE